MAGSSNPFALGRRRYASRHAEDGPTINAAGLEMDAMIASVGTGHLTHEG